MLHEPVGTLGYRDNVTETIVVGVTYNLKKEDSSKRNQPKMCQYVTNEMKKRRYIL